MPISKENVGQAIKIQREIFPLEHGENDIKSCVDKKIAQYYSLIEYQLVKCGKNYVGICGLYAYCDYPKDAWLAWFGVREKYRKNGYGTQILQFCIENARKKGYANLRLYTDDIENSNAVRLYTKFGMKKEVYKNKKDRHFEVGKTLIFSLGLTGRPVKPWRSKYLFLKEHDVVNGTIL